MKPSMICLGIASMCFTLSAFAIAPGAIRQGAVTANVGAPQAAMQSQQQAQANKMMQKKQKKMREMHQMKNKKNVQDSQTLTLSPTMQPD